MEKFMLPQTGHSQTEDTQQIGAQIRPFNDVGTRRRSRKSWLALAIAVIVVAALLVSGIWSRGKARNTLNTETAQAVLPSVSVVSPKPTAPAAKLFLPSTVLPFLPSPPFSPTPRS